MEEQVIDIDGQILTKTTTYGNDGDVTYRNTKGQKHRIGGPAVLHLDVDYQAYYVEGKRHRLDGPAKIFPCGVKEYWVNDIQYNKEQYPKAVFEFKLKQLIG
jgi:hypothetical protein